MKNITLTLGFHSQTQISLFPEYDSILYLKVRV